MSFIVEKLIVKFHRIRFTILFGRKKSSGCSIFGSFSIKNVDRFHFENGLTINDYVYINAANGISLGKNVSISAGAKLISLKLNYVAEGAYEHIGGPILIGSNVQIGAGSIILPGVSICSNVIVGAGCIVSKSITEPGIYVGVPARKIR
ncbi:acyltransferase [Aeromonas caviae]|uniref:acyltransferase n=1 Tax=Aeromonas caviae TaxID=648 RepID=UPI002B496B63|nr:acyltransferase [Aeromonas caviae]